MKKQMAFEKVMTLWIMIKNHGEKCSFRLQKLSVGSKIKRHFAKSTTKTFWPQALKHHVDVTSQNLYKRFVNFRKGLERAVFGRPQSKLL